MKQTLQLKLSQHLTLTPQLQQSIRLLQLSTVELNAEVERMLQENPLLEKADGEDESPLPGAAQAGSTIVPDKDPRAERKDNADAPSDQGSSEERREIDGVDRSDFEDYSSGDSDWGSASGSDDDDGCRAWRAGAGAGAGGEEIGGCYNLKIMIGEKMIISNPTLSAIFSTT